MTKEPTHSQIPPYKYGVNVNYEQLYGNYHKSVEKQQKLRDEVARKALNMPIDDDMNIDQDIKITKTGFGWKEILALSAVGLGTYGIIATGFNFGRQNTPPSAITATPPLSPVQPIPSVPPLSDSEYQVLFYDKDGNLISVPHISTRPKGG